MEDIIKKAKLIVPEHWDNNKRGKFWEELVADLLRKRGFHVKERVIFTGMEADCLAYNPETYQEAWVECKFQKKPINSEILNKLIGVAFRKGVTFAYLFSTSDLGSDARGILDEEDRQNRVRPGRTPRLVFIGTESIAQWFIELNNIKIPELNNVNLGKVEILTLLINPEQPIWVAEEIQRGEPCRAIIFPTSEQQKINFAEISSEFSRLSLWQGLEIIDGAKISNKTVQVDVNSLEIDKEVVSSIGVAESFDHYQRPCRPEDFVGRLNLREQIWSFIKSLRDGQTLTRIICISGRSGLGKSSLVLRLAEDCLQNKSYKKSFYFHHVDVRSAKGALFVVSAIRLAFQKAIDSGFIEISNPLISIGSTEQPLLDNQSIKQALEQLKAERKFIIIFFDQFEEVFTKESLFCVYEAFEKLAYEVDSLKEHIVLGFCWRTGIIMPDGHKAYHLWHGLSDKRIEFEINEFFTKESETLLNGFDNYLQGKRKPLDRKLKRWLLEHCPGFPWLLRKVCSDIYNQLLSESEIIPSRQIDIKSLFDKDLERFVTNGEQQRCIEYIAHHSPISMHEVIERFGTHIVQGLEDNRLIIRTGINYTIYWDIFKEYILEKKVPTIPLSYRPRNQIINVLDLLKLLISIGKQEIDVSEVYNKAKHQKPTVKNIISDLQNFYLINCYNNQIQVNINLINSENHQIAEHIKNQLDEHIVIREIYKELRPGKMMTLWGFQNFVAKAYCIEESENKKTTQDYASRMISWFLFTGLLEKKPNGLIARPIGEGRQKGKPLECVVSVYKENTEPPLLKLLN